MRRCHWREELTAEALQLRERDYVVS